MLKPRITAIINDFFAIGGNHDLEKYQLIRNKLLNVLREEEFLLDEGEDENVMLIRDGIRLIDASSLYAEETNPRRAYKRMKPFFTHLENESRWHYYNLHILVSSIYLTETVEQAVKFAKSAQGYINVFKRTKNTYSLEAALAVNLCARILNAKFFESDTKISLVTEFQKWLEKLEALTESNHDLAMPLLVTEIRQALLIENDTNIKELCTELEARYDKKISALIKNEIEFYQNQRK